MAPYQYQELIPTIRENESSCIRLLTLLPGSGGETVRCQLQVTQLSQVVDNETYEALSYCWGDPEATPARIVLSNVGEAEVEFAVQPNLHRALCAFRFEDRSRTLWIDAICINQMDDFEKSGQIPLMRQIYEGGIRTLIWLGESTADSKPAMDLVRSLKAAWTRCRGTIPKIGMLNSHNLVQHGLPSLLSSDYVKLLTMLEQPWFERAWIVQEVTVSKQAQVYWRPQSVDWQDLVIGIHFATLAEMPFAMHSAIRRLIQIADEAECYKGGNCRLLAVLLRHWSCKAKEPLDKVYGFMGLTEGGQGNFIPITVNYHQDVAGAYTDVARRIAEHDYNLDILSRPATPFESNMKHLPTWAPDWSLTPGIDLRQTISAEGGSLANAEETGGRFSAPFCASASAFYVPTNETSFVFLTVEGHKLDTITTAEARYDGCHMPSAINVLNTLQEINKTTASVFRTRNVYMQWEDSFGLPASSSQKYINGEAMVDAFYQTLMVGNIDPVDNKSTLREEYLRWSHSQRPAPLLNRFKLGFLQTSLSAVQSLTNSVLNRDVVTTFQKRAKNIIFRRLVKTSKGYMGLACGNVVIGDQIWLLKGCKVPVVLRDCGDGEKWRVIGDAYVHGVMYGEAFVEKDCQRIVLV